VVGIVKMHDKISAYFLPVGRQKLLDIVNKVEHEGKTLIKTMVESKENKIGEGKITSN
jgi:hypothetical protein